MNKTCQRISDVMINGKATSHMAAPEDASRNYILSFLLSRVILLIWRLLKMLCVIIFIIKSRVMLLIMSFELHNQKLHANRISWLKIPSLKFVYFCGA